MKLLKIFLLACIVMITGIYADEVSRSDILWHNSSTGAVKFMPINSMIPEDTLSVVDSSNTNLLPKGMGDFTRDGQLDILFHNQNSGNLRIWEMNGTIKGENIQVLGSSNINLMIAGVGDFDGDGDNDIATFNTNSGALRIWVMEGTVRVDNILVFSGANTNLVPRGAGDMDGDGIPDLLLRNNNSGAVRIWTMNSAFTRKGNEYIRSSSNTNLELRGVVDINGDGNNDILNYNINTGMLRAWLMDGYLSIIENATITQEADLRWSVRGGDANILAKGLIIETEDDENPYITIGDNGNIVSFEVNSTTAKPTGITIITSDGREGYLAIDEESGMPDYWVALDTITVFGNIRPDERLMDISFIYEDGTTATVEDFYYGELMSPVSNISSISNDKLLSRSTDDSSTKRKKFINFLNALDATFSVTACIGGTILTGGAAFAGVTFPPAGVPLFAVTSGATAVACGTAFVKFMALDPDNAKISGLNDALGVPGVAESVAECLTKPGVLMCVKSTADVVGFAASGLVKGVMATYIRLRDGRSKLNNQWAYCCNGPTQIKKRTSGTWQAGVDPLFLDTPSYWYHFYFGGKVEVVENSNEVLHSASHEFRDEGNYMINVRVDDANTFAVSNKFLVEVYGDLEVTCDIYSFEAKKNEAFQLPFNIKGGKKPFSYTLNFGNGVTQSGKSIKRAIHEQVILSEVKSYSVNVAVEDADGELSECPLTLDITETGPLTGEEICALTPQDRAMLEPIDPSHFINFISYRYEDIPGAVAGCNNSSYFPYTGQDVTHYVVLFTSESAANSYYQKVRDEMASDLLGFESSCNTTVDFGDESSKICVDGAQHYAIVRVGRFVVAGKADGIEPIDLLLSRMESTVSAILTSEN